MGISYFLPIKIKGYLPYMDQSESVTTTILPKPDQAAHVLSGWRFRAMIITIIISMLVYLLFTLWGGWRQVIEAVTQVGPLGILFTLSLSLLCYGVRFLRWELFLNILGYKLPTTANLRIYIAGFSLTTTPGKSGEALRGIFLKDYGVPHRKSFAAFLAERFSDLIAMAVLSIIGLWHYPQTRPAFFITIAALIFFLYAVQKDNWLHTIEKLAVKTLPKRLAHIAEFFIETIIGFRSCFTPRMLSLSLALSVIAWASEGVGLYYLVYFLGYEVDLLTSLFIFGFSMLVGAITFLPGGIGGTEVTMVKLLILQGLDSSSAVAITLLLRLATLWFSVVLGLIALPKKQLIIKN
jgi:uncharacterized protein (TIRG00374 family)